MKGRKTDFKERHAAGQPPRVRREEMRKQLLGVFLPLLILGLLAAAAETRSTGTGATKRAALQRLQVTHGEDGISIEITARGQLTPKLNTLDSPARVMLDLPNTVAATEQRHIGVDSDGVKSVRIGMDGQTPPTTRIVVDLVQACRYELVPGSNNKLVLKLHTAAESTQTTAATKMSVASTAFVGKNKSTSSKSAVATGAVPSSEMKTVESTSAANDFVFVEPSVEPRNEAKSHANKSTVIAPPVRTIEAAAKFADKSASELLATKSNASMQPEALQAAGSAIQPAVNMAAEQKTQMAQAPGINGPKYTGEPISVNLKDVDLKDFFRLIHEISGLNVVLDPAVKGTLTIVLDEVPWDQALDIVMQNNSLDKQLNGNVLRIATRSTLQKEAETQRDLEKAQAEAVAPVTVPRVLSYAKASTMAPILKKFLSSRGDVLFDERSNQLIIRDIPSVIPTLDNLIRNLDRKAQQVEIEARVVSASRSFSRDIGTQLAFSGTSLGGRNIIGGNQQVGTSQLNQSPIAPPPIASYTGSTYH